MSMKKLAVIGFMTVALLVAGLNLYDAKYPGALHRLREASAASPAPESTAPLLSADLPAPSPTAPEAIEVEPLWPGSTIDQLTYGSRRYVELTVVSVTAESVTFRGDKEVVSVPTGSLPDSVRLMAIAYLGGGRLPTSGRSGSPAFPAGSTAAAGSSVGQPGPGSAGSASQATIPKHARAIVMWAARERIDEWLRFERVGQPTDIQPLMTGADLEEPLPLTGRIGHWRVTGRGYVATRQQIKGGTFHDFEVTLILDREDNIVGTKMKVY